MRWSEEEYQGFISKKENKPMSKRKSKKSINNSKSKKSKYKAKKTAVDNIKFDSKKEAKRYKELKILKKAGKIKNLELQPEFILQPKFKKNGKTFRAIKYIADFKYLDENNNVVVEDVKGVETQVFKLKHKMFENKYKDLTLKIVR